MSINPTSRQNDLTGFVPVKGVWAYERVKIKASTVLQMGDAVGIEISSNTTTGFNTVMGVENASGADFVGIYWDQLISSGDSDYASTTKFRTVAIPVSADAEAQFTVGAGTFTAVDVGKRVEIHSDNRSLAVDTAGKGASITRYISSTKGLCKFNLPTTETA